MKNDMYHVRNQAYKLNVLIFTVCLHISKKKNEEADMLSWLGSTRETFPSAMFLTYLFFFENHVPDILTMPSIHLEAKHEDVTTPHMGRPKEAMELRKSKPSRRKRVLVFMARVGCNRCEAQHGK